MMIKQSKHHFGILLLCVFALLAGLLFCACPTETKPYQPPVEDEFDPNDPDPAFAEGFFTKAPGLTLATGDNPQEIDCNFVAALPGDIGTTYTMYIISGNVLRRQEIIDGGVAINRSQSLLNITYIFKGNAGENYSAVLVATKGDEKAYSPVRQAMAMVQLVEAAPGEETGTLKSLGKATAPGAVTYYVDYKRGNDGNDGQSPLSAWRSLARVNKETFNPGDHILLEAHSVWNGVSTTADNWDTLINSTGVGMLWPKGNGSDKNHIVIDLYRLESAGGSLKVFYSANQRPIINGNGTPPPGSNRWFPSGAITLINQHHWRIRNIEVTNTFKNFLTEPNHWYDTQVPKHLIGIAVLGWGDTRSNDDYRGVVDPNDITTYNVTIENCYVHDVQSMHQNNGGGGGFNNSPALGGTPSPVFKVVGGIIVYGMPNTSSGATPASNYFGYNGLLFEGNIVKRVGLEGLRNKSVPDGSGYANSNVVFRGNYLEDIFGDAIVIDGIQRGDGSSAVKNSRSGYMNGLVENNIIKDSCAAPNSLSANYAAVWAMTCYDTTFQYNEAYGSVYGWNDGEAWDIDNGSDKVIYQYNYSHHNAGGAILFMSSITNGIFRYNISANDGGGTRYMATVTSGVNSNANSFTSWNNGQALFHYTNTGTTSNNNKPLIYNNTFYIGDGVTTGVFGQNETSAVNKYVRFYNNVLLKAGAGTVYLSYGQSGNGSPGYIYNPAGFRNNLLWAYNTDPAVGDKTKFNNGSQGLAAVLDVNDNVWANPKLKIQTVNGAVAELRAQRDSKFPEADYNNPAKLAAFTGTERFRSRASIFTPADSSSPVIGAGMAIPKGANPAALDTAWNDVDALSADMFGSAFSTPPIGAAAAPYTP